MLPLEPLLPYEPELPEEPQLPDDPELPDEPELPNEPCRQPASDVSTIKPHTADNAREAMILDVVFTAAAFPLEGSMVSEREGTNAFAEERRRPALSMVVGPAAAQPQHSPT
jgi:hypothetical protein